MKYYGKTPTTLTCKNITCLSDLLQVLKIDKDTVQHFIQQKQRLDARLRLAEKKREKSDDFETTRDYLVSSLGGERALANDSPICAGKVNTTRARDVRQNNSKKDNNNIKNRGQGWLSIFPNAENKLMKLAIYLLPLTQ